MNKLFQYETITLEGETIHPTTAFQKYVGGAVNRSFEMCNIMPFESKAQARITLWLCEDQYEELCEKYQDGTLSADESKLLEKVREAMGWFMLYEYHPFAQVQLSDSGLHRVENEKHKTAYKYQANEVRYGYLCCAFLALEKLLRFLKKYGHLYPTWYNSPCRAELDCLLINWTKDFNAYSEQKIDRCAFECLRPIMKRVECFLLEACFGEKFINYLRELCATPVGDLRPCDIKLKNLICMAMVDHTLAQAMERSMLSLREGKVVRPYAGTNDAAKPYNPADAKTLEKAKDVYLTWGKCLWEKVKAHLDKYQDKYPLYEDFCVELCECECSCECEALNESEKLDYDMGKRPSKILAL